MQYADYILSNDLLIPSTVTLGDASTPVWRQNRWSTGAYQEFIRKNGCGHCCAAMALNLHGIKNDPHDEFSLCRRLWGVPNDQNEFLQGNYQSVAGITKILHYYGLQAEYFGVPDIARVEKHFDESLKAGKQIIFWSHPTEGSPENPFSPNEHYVLAVGYTRDNAILVANSSETAATEGVQLVDLPTVMRALFFGASPSDMTWGCNRFINCAGYVVVG